MCSSPKDRGVRHTHYKHLHSINGDIGGDAKDHHYKEIADAAIERREAMDKLEQRYKKRHPNQKKSSLWEKLINLFR